jgi:hypothetical protein
MTDRRGDGSWVPLREHVEALALERDRRYEQRFQAQEEALRVERETHKREMAGVNELRGQLNDVIDTMAPKGETNIRISAVDAKVDEVIRAVAASAGRSTGLGAGWSYLLGAIGALGILYGVITALLHRGS